MQWKKMSKILDGIKEIMPLLRTFKENKKKIIIIEYTDLVR